MQTFLDKAAAHICQQHSLAKLSQLCVVLPSRRGVFFFKQALAKQALAKQENQPFFTPDVWAIDDFVSQTTGLREIDPMSLLFELFDVFKEIDPEIKFDRFMTWASTLLSDFDRIDLYLIDAKALFAWMTEAKAIERWNADRLTYTKATKHTDRFFKLYENIYTVYQNLRQRLRDKRLVYRGMAYRQLAEDLQQKRFEKVSHEKYYFVGFNALSISEEEFFRILYDTHRAEMLWDTDDFYMESKDQEAGQWLRSYKTYKDEKGFDKNYFGGANHWNWQSNDLIKGQKNIQVIGVPNASMQAKVAGHIYKGWFKNSRVQEFKSSAFDDDVPPNQTSAIVLGDENLLVPLMNSLDVPPEVFNITMGLSLKSSMLFTLIDALFELQRNLVAFQNKEGEKVKIPKFSHRHIVKILNHPYVRRYELVNYPTDLTPRPPLQRKGGVSSEVETISELTPSVYPPSPLERGSGGEVSGGNEVSEPTLHYMTTDARTWHQLEPFAKQNRQNPTKTESILWNEIRNRKIANFKFRRQHVIGSYIVDFLCLEYKLVIEIDGDIHEQDDNPAYDQARTEYLNKQGFEIIRFTNEEVKNDLVQVINEIQETLETLKEGKKINNNRTKFNNTKSQPTDSPSPLERQPLLRELESKVNPIRQTLQTIINQNRVFLDTDELLEMGENDALFKILFTRWDASPQKAIASFYQLVDVLREIYKPNPEAIETEYFYQFYLILQRLEGILEERKQAVQLRNFRTFLFELIKQNKIPFSGEHIAQLQIMGMLETRTLDFERLILLSVNEGVLPSGKKQNSLIPFDACIEFGLPTHSQQDAVMAYHFYRLLQRAKEVVILHVLPSDTYGGGEKSRFLLQIEHELAYINRNIQLSYPKVRFKVAESQYHNDELRIEKTPDIVAFIENDITQNGIYPSHLNQFMTCGLQYYFSRVARIQEAEEVEDTLAADRFGNWIHKTFENIDKEFLANAQRQIQPEDLQKILENLPQYLETAFKETNRGLQHQAGLNYIFYQVGEKIVRDFLTYQLENETFPIQLLDAEKKVSVTFDTEVQGKQIPLKISGRIDRIDRINENEIRVIDYKTGKVEAKDLQKPKDQSTVETLEEKERDKYRQLWLYKYMVLKRMSTSEGLRFKEVKLQAEDHTVSAGIYSFRNIKEGFLKQNVSFEEHESVANFLQASENQLSNFANQLLDTAKPFERTTNLDSCQVCTYRRICGR